MLDHLHLPLLLVMLQTLLLIGRELTAIRRDEAIGAVVGKRRHAAMRIGMR